MVTSVKGIQYSYQIDFFNQVPTRLKSQVHNLPSLSVQQPTPIDDNTGQDSVIPNNDSRNTFAGVRATPNVTEFTNTSSAVDTKIPNDTLVPETASISRAAPPPPAQPAVSPSPLQQPFTLTTLEPNENRVIGRPEISENLFSPVASQPQNNQRVNPAVEAEDFPVADRNPMEPVKGIPKSEFVRAQKAYNPDYGSYLQATGYENPFQAGNVKTEAAPAPISRPEIVSPVQQNPIEVTNTSIQPKVQAQPEIKAPEPTTEAELRTKDQEKTIPNQIQSFVMRQAQRMYEVFGSSELLSNNNRVDLYF